MTKHYLKTWPSVFAAVKSGAKSWEFRRNDRDFEVGDVLILCEWDPAIRRSYETINHAANRIALDVTYIVHGGRFGIPEGFCVMSIRPRDNEEGP